MISQKHIKDSERKFVNLMNENGFFAQRVAGSGCGKHSVCDVISAISQEIFLTEVKSTKDVKLRLTKKDAERIRLMMSKAVQNPPLKSMMVIHWKKRGWQQIVLETGFDPQEVIVYDEKNTYPFQ